MCTNEAIKTAVENIATGLTAMIEEAVKGAIENTFQANSNLVPSVERSSTNPEDDFTDIYGAMKITNYKRNTIYDYVGKNKIPHQKISRKLIFSKSELIAWIKASRVKTEVELSEEAQNYVANKKIGRNGRK
jgi:predicted DNA-binding transcriptional regulator AlpA